MDDRINGHDEQPGQSPGGGEGGSENPHGGAHRGATGGTWRRGVTGRRPLQGVKTRARGRVAACFLARHRAREIVTVREEPELSETYCLRLGPGFIFIFLLSKVSATPPYRDPVLHFNAQREAGLMVPSQ